MPETIIVTVQWNGQEADFEIPALVPIRCWSQMFGATAKLCFKGFSLQEKEIQFLLDGKQIPSDYTMEQCGIYDGSILELRIQ